MSTHLHPDRLFPADAAGLAIARRLFAEVKDLPIISPHGHTDPAWFASNENFTDAADLFVVPDHYLLRMFRSQGLSYDDFGIAKLAGAEPDNASPPEVQPADRREIWRRFCANYHLFAATPSKIWIDHSLSMFFGINQPLSVEIADETYDEINQKLSAPDMRPMAILDASNVEIIATTEYALDPLDHHQALAKKGLLSRIRTTYRPDDVSDPDNPAFTQNLETFGGLTGENTSIWAGMIKAHAARRAFFRQYGATATDHGVPSAVTCDLSSAEKQKLLDGALQGKLAPAEAEQFRGQMLTEMAALSAEDGMTMQIHAGSSRNHDKTLLATYGRDKGADIPQKGEFTNALKPLLNLYGTSTNFNLILFTLDETTYARELAPLAGYWPTVKIGPPWWFHDSSAGIRRYFDQTIETAGVYNLAGFNDDTRALLSIPARHDVWRRETCRFLAEKVAERVLDEDQALKIGHHLCYAAAKEAYSL